MDLEIFGKGVEMGGFILCTVYILADFIINRFSCGRRISQLERQVELILIQKVSRDSLELMKKELKPQIGDK